MFLYHRYDHDLSNSPQRVLTEGLNRSTATRWYSRGVEEDTTLIWISYDGDALDIISNHPVFRTMEDIETTLPKGIEMSVVEYEVADDVSE